MAADVYEMADRFLPQVLSSYDKYKAHHNDPFAGHLVGFSSKQRLLFKEGRGRTYILTDRRHPDLWKPHPYTLHGLVLSG